MKISIFFAFMFLLVLQAEAQVPQAVKYQAVARDTDGELMIEKELNIRLTIIDSAQGGVYVYQEVHKTNTNRFGLFTVQVGRGLVQSGVFENIDWKTGRKWAQIEMDPGFTLIGRFELLSVPYALYAESASNILNDQDSQTLSINGNLLSISNGNTVLLPDSIGPQGPAGPQGAQGPPGPAGAQGLPGGQLPPDTTFFDPHYPDGTVNMIGVTLRIDSLSPYTVPQGKNLHITSMYATGRGMYINGIHRFAGNMGTHEIICAPGDIITTADTANRISGYLIDQKVIPVNTSLTASPYVVPGGKQLFVTIVGAAAPYKAIFINGIKLSGYPTYGVRPLILNPGDIISTDNMDLSSPSQLYGYLK